MRRCALAFFVMMSVVLPLGCSGDGVAYTRQERQEMHRRVRDTDARQLTDDLDYLLLQEQPSHLSRWAIE